MRQRLFCVLQSNDDQESIVSGDRGMDFYFSIFGSFPRLQVAFTQRCRAAGDGQSDQNNNNNVLSNCVDSSEL